VALRQLNFLLENNCRDRAADTQRAKVERFTPTHRFDHIQIKGELGFGKAAGCANCHQPSSCQFNSCRNGPSL
jgi:hypothetical protein